MDRKQLKSWNDVTLRQAQELIALDPKSYGEDEVLAYEVDQLAILLDQDPYHIESTMSVKEILSELEDWNFLNQLPKENMAKRVDTFVWDGKTFTTKNWTLRLNGKRYGLCDFNELTLAQMVDIEEYVNLGIIQNIHNIMAVLYLPVKSFNRFTGKYVLEPYEPDAKRAEMFLDLDMEFVYGNLLFFYHIVTTYMTHIQDSLVAQATQTLTKMKTMI